MEDAMKRKNFPDRRALRREDAAVRQAYYDALTHEQKVASAMAAPGQSKRGLIRLNAWPSAA